MKTAAALSLSRRQIDSTKETTRMSTQPITAALRRNGNEVLVGNVSAVQIGATSAVGR
jgi:hypothetical protein